MSLSKARLLVPEREKTQQWIKDVVSEIKDLSTTTKTKNIDQICWNYFYNKIETENFDYLTKIGSNQLPTEMRHVPCQRVFLDVLISQQTARGFAYSAVFSDKNSIREKNDDKAKYITDIMLNKSRSKYHELTFALEQLDMQFQLAQEQYQQAEQIFQQQQQQQQQQGQQQEQQITKQQLLQMKMALMSADHEMQKMKSAFNDGLLLNDADLQEFSSKYKNNYRFWKEELLQKISHKLRMETKLKNKSVENFTQYCVTGKQAYNVFIQKGQKYPTINATNCMDLYYPSINNVDYIQNLPWIKEDMRISFDDVVRLYGKEIVKEYGTEALEGLESNLAVSESTMWAGPNGEGYFVDDSMQNSTDKGYDTFVSKIYFKSPKEIYIKYSPNKYEQGEYFRKYILSNKYMLKEEDYKFDKATNSYINKVNEKEVYNKEDVELYSEKKGQKYIAMYMTDLYEAIVINRQYIVDCKKSEFVLRDPDDWSNVLLPYFGPAFNGSSKRPYSLIWATKGLQDIYNILYMQRDLMIALSGTKTILYDRAQKPMGLTDEEVDYNRKLGKIEIETVSQDGRKINTSFNQWSMFDMSLSQSVSQYDNMLMNAQTTMGEIIGVPRQRIGSIVQADQVGTTEMALRQASLVTEIYYFNHDTYEAQALEAAVNLFVRYQLNEKSLFDIYEDDYTSEQIELHKEMFKDCKAEVKISNNSEHDKKMQMLHDMIMRQHQEGQLPINNVISLFNVKSLRELESKAKYFAEEAQKIAQQNAGAQANAEMEKEQRLIQLKQEFEKYWRDNELQFKSQQEEVSTQLKQTELQLLAEKNQIEREKINIESKMKLLALVNEDKTEQAYLESQNMTNEIEQQLKQTQMKLDAMFNIMQLEDSRDAANKSHHASLQKIKVDEIKAKSLPKKEHIID